MSTHPPSPVPIAPSPVLSGDARSDFDLTESELHACLDLAAGIKSSPKSYSRALDGMVVSLLFEKPSLRTRITFEVAAKQLGGDSILYTGPIGGREPVKDVARNLERWTSMIVARTFSQTTVDELAAWSSSPVINALSDLYHPCQALADMLTLREHWGGFDGRTLAFVGDGNNVAHSLMLDCARLGVNFTCITPPGYEPSMEILAAARRFAAATGAAIRSTDSLEVGLAGANAVYTDVWASMGQEHEAAERARLFASYQVNAALMSMAAPGALFMHCLPAHREEETTDEVMESPVSVIFDQAENRLHAQKSLMLMLACGDKKD
ncbi:MAG: ornithine carbamoyltransferase [Bryobacteraceae bacterium]|nr:ornithine carbamoyltransferase [Bryobacteraceae bacterium]